MRVSRWGFLAGCLLGLGSCTSPVDEPGSTVPGSCAESVPLIAPQKTDILFVIDDSNSMKEEQERVASELQAFVGALQQGAGVAVDFRVGGDHHERVRELAAPEAAVPDELPVRAERRQPLPAGQLRPVPGSGERFLESSDPNLTTKFAALVQQGVDGSGQETPFEAVRLAVSPPLSTTPLDQGGNAGFLRDGARLLVVVLTDEDDCSEDVRPPRVAIGGDKATNYCRDQEANLTSVADYFAIFRDLRESDGRLRDVAWAAIAPVALADKRAEQIVDAGQVRNADCPTSYGPGFRHREMASLFDPALQNLDSICNASFHDSLVRIAALATVNQTVEISGVPDPALLKVEIVRGGGTTQVCTVANDGIRFQPSVDSAPGRILFQGDCLRRSDDQDVQVKLLCAG